jgi:serine/threonine protein kinase
LFLFLKLQKENKLYQVYLENEMLNRLNNERVVKVDGIFEENEKIFIVMEYISNGDFYRFLKLNGKISHQHF